MKLPPLLGAFYAIQPETDLVYSTQCLKDSSHRQTLCDFVNS